MRHCPSPSELEAFAVGGTTNPAIGAHLARCAPCRAGLDEIRANQRFMACGETALAAAFDAARTESQTSVTRPLPLPGTVPGFELVEEISRGGQGVVYRAIQTDSNRPAAVKMLLAGAFASGAQRRRFEREIEIAARLRHPSIVSVFDSGKTSDGRRYVAMEYVPGKSLDRFVRERLPLKGRGGRARTDQIMRLIQLVAEGVGHAHANGVMHRDLKPSNILVDAEGKPRVLDFGLARSAESEHGATVTHEFAGTVAYAAPEQFSSAVGLVNTRTDVYSLGLVLYAALTGTHPYPCEGSIAEISKHVLTTEPFPPSRLVPRLPSDVETIVLKALSKDPARRYPSAGAMASDIDDYLNGRPISARRDSTMYVLRTLAMKHRIPVAAGVLVLLTVVAAAIGLALLASDLDRSQRNTEAALSESKVQRARLMGAAGDVGQAESLLWAEALAAGMSTDDTLCVGGSPGSLRSAWSLTELYSRLPRLFRARVSGTLGSVGLDPAQRTVWAIDRAGSRSTWTLEGRLLNRTPALLPPGQESVALASPDGRYVVVQSRDAFTLYDLDQSTTMAGPIPWNPEFAIDGVSDDGLLLVFQRRYRDLASRTAGDGALRIFYVRANATVAQFDDHAFSTHFQRSAESLFLLVGTRSDSDPRVMFRRAPDWTVARTIPMPDGLRDAKFPGVRNPRLSPDGSLLTATVEQGVYLASLSGQRELDRVGDLIRSPIQRCELDELGQKAVMSGNDGTIVVFRVPGLTPLMTVHNGVTANGLAIRSDLNVIAACDYSGSVSVYEASDRPWLERVPASGVTAQCVAVAPNGTLAWGDDEGVLTIRPDHAMKSTTTPHAHAGRITSVDFSPDGTEILTAGSDGSVQLWHLNGSLLRTIAKGLPEIWSARFGPDGRTIAWGERGGLVRVWKDDTTAAAFTLDCHADRVPMIAFSPDGEFLVSAVAGGVVRVWDPSTGGPLQELTAPSRTSRAVAVAPDGRTIVAGYDDRTVIVWDSKGGTKLRTISGLPWSPFDLKFEPGGRVLYAVGNGGEIIVIDPNAGTELAKLAVHDKGIFSLCLGSGGRRLYTSGQDPWIGITDLDHLRTYLRGNEAVWKEELAGNNGSPGARAGN